MNALGARGGLVAGVDGCPGGWVVVTRTIDDPTTAIIHQVADFAAVLALPGLAGVIAVDMPIGLPERGGIGGRPADVEARGRLGARQSSVFSVPARAALMEADYARACAVAAAYSDPPRRVSKQMFHLFPKIREVDALMTPRLQARVVECHPELAFWAMAGERALLLPKKVKSRAHGPGLDERRDLLARAGYGVAIVGGGDGVTHGSTHGVRYGAMTGSTPGFGPDDLLDAAANSWTAARIATGSARRFPADPPLDARGLRMEIWA